MTTEYQFLDSKRVSEVLDFKVDFTKPLAGDTIATWEVTSDDVTIGEVSIDQAVIKAWVSGGQPSVKRSAIITFKAVTGDGRTLVYPIALTIDPDLPA